jgi:hypothetical protein
MHYFGLLLGFLSLFELVHFFVLTNRIPVIRILDVRVNSFPVISVLEVRVTAFFTSKIHAIKKMKGTDLFGSALKRQFQSKLVQPSTLRGIELTSIISNQWGMTTDPVSPHYITSYMC